MTRIDDDRLLFFIEHARQIREWAALGEEVRDIANRFLTTMYERWEDRDDLPLDAITVCRGIDGAYPHLRLHLDEWLDDSGAPLVRVAISWNTRTVGLDPRSAPYVGVTTNPTTKEGKDRSNRLRKALEPHRAAVGATSETWWPSFRRIPPTVENDFIDLERYESRLIDELHREWKGAAATVSEVLGLEKAPTEEPS